MRYTCIGLEELDASVVKVSNHFSIFFLLKFLSFCFFTNTIFFLEIGAVFNFICTDRDQMIMEKIERHFAHYIPEVLIMLF